MKEDFLALKGRHIKDVNIIDYQEDGYRVKLDLGSDRHFCFWIDADGKLTYSEYYTEVK